MVIVGDIYFYKTPLDANHNNIIDFITVFNGEDKPSPDFDYNGEYFSIIDDYYPNKMVFHLNGSKSLKMNNLNTTITLPILSQLYLDYNYIVVKEKITGKFKFFFIGNIISENDSESNPSTTFSLIYDFWANSLEEFYSNEQIEYVTTSHKQRIFYREDTDELYLKYNSEVGTKSNGHIVNIKPNSRDYNILWIKVVFNTNLQLILNEGEENETTKVYDYVSPVKGICRATKYSPDLLDVTPLPSSYVGAVEDYSKQITAYIPYAVLDYTNNKYYDFDIVSEGHTVELSDESTIVFDSQTYEIQTDRLMNFISSQNSYFQSMELTFYTPVKYTYSFEPSTEKITIYTPNDVILVDGKIPFISKAFPVTEYESFNDINNVNFGINSTITIGVSPDDFGYPTASTFSPANLKSELFINKTIDPSNYVKPIKYPYVIFNNEEIELPIIREIFPSYNFIIDIRTGEPLLKMVATTPFPSISLINPTFIHNNGQIGITTLSKDDYLIRNGSQQQMAIENSKIANVLAGAESVNGGILKGLKAFESQTTTSWEWDKESGYGSKMQREGRSTYGKVLGVIEGVTDAGFGVADAIVKHQTLKRNVNALMQDLTRTPSLVQSSTGSGDNYYQDGLRFYLYECDDDYIVDRVLYNSFLYGSYRAEFRDIRFNNRFMFDYIKTDNCILKGIMNQFCKNLIEEMYNGGVHRQHVLYIDGEREDVFNESFSRDITTVWNIEKQFLYHSNYNKFLREGGTT